MDIETTLDSTTWSCLPWFRWQEVVATFFPLAAPYLNMDPLTKATLAVTQFAQWVSKVRNPWILNFLWNMHTWP